ncbi:glycoside hydrolase family 3 N-terminal domain-containing protein [Persicobacter diffluens]|uniref:beta-glucosidase n=1 Tax=Persicobacter diffluens TaxID=981 RepID=A0AAN5AL54_9BACT|nr:glycosyl hydrolase [Persicobacter diffluens]
MKSLLIGMAMLVGAGGNLLAQEKDMQIEDLLSKMTVEEKAGQMTQLTLEFVSKGDGYAVASPHELDPEKLHKVLVDYHVGSILNCAGEARTPERWYEMISQMQEYAMQKSRLPIPVLYGIDAVHGVNYTVGATLFPQEVSLAASWNPEIVEKMAAITAYECRASAIPWTFAPDLDLGIDPRWARIWEGFGEDPYLASEMGVAMTKGFEGEDVGDKDRVAACVKHFVGYGAPRSGKDRTPAWIPETMLRELFLPPFQAAIDAGARSIMINSGEVNGVPVHASKWLLTDVLRGEMGFQGVVVTDWYDIWNLVERHHVAADRREAVKMSVLAGIDMSMVPMDLEFTELLIDLIKSGEIPMEHIDAAVRRILIMKKELGLFERPVTNPKDYPLFGSAQHEAVAKEAALESITLLKNEAVLPLKKDQKILVTGPNANTMRPLNGGWSYTWQGHKTDEFAKKHASVLSALRQFAGNKNVKFVPGVSYEMEKTYEYDKRDDFEKAVAAAQDVDVVVLCIGENSYTEKPGDLNNLALSEHQHALAEALLATGKPVVMVLNAGRPRIIQQLEPNTAAIVHTYLPGNHGGEALVDLLYGEANFSGKLPYTYPRDVNDLVPYYHKFSENMAHNDGNEYTDPFFNPQWEFGFGLSYSDFVYSDMQINKSSFEANEVIELSVVVKNASQVDGKEVVQLYSTDVVASITPSVKRLRAFEKVSLKAGESKTVRFRLPMKSLAFIGADHKPTLEPGEFVLQLGDQKESIQLTGVRMTF